MSSILLENSSTAPLFEVEINNGGLQILGQNNQINILSVGESNNGEYADDSIVGGGRIDIIKAGLGNDIIIGRAGDDILEGEGDDDILIGGSGADVLRGGSGVDVITGGAGDDKFEFFADDFVEGEVDKITDFTQDKGGSIEDVIVIRGIGAEADVSYDSISGRVSVNGTDIIQLDLNLDITADNADGDDDWELF